MMSKLSAAVLGLALVVAGAMGVKLMVFGQARTEKNPTSGVSRGL